MKSDSPLHHERADGLSHAGHAPGAQPRLLLTGATGFLGSHLLRALLEGPYEVVVLKRSTSDTRRIDDLLGRVNTIDVDERPIAECFDRPVGVVVHVATAFGRKGETPSEVVASNVSFPMRLLETLEANGGGAFLNTDTFLSRSHVAPQGLENYVHTKSCFRECAYHYASRRGIRYADLHLEHVFGPDDGETKFVPAVVKAFLRDEPSFQLTEGRQVRDFIHVSDVVAAYLALIERSLVENLPRTVEIGTGQAMTLRAFVELAREVTGARTSLEFGALPYRTGELMQSVADPAYLQGLGWHARKSVREGLLDVVQRARMADGPTNTTRRRGSAA